MKPEELPSAYGLRDHRQRKFNFEEAPERKRKIRKMHWRHVRKLQQATAFASCSSTEFGDSCEDELKSGGPATGQVDAHVQPVQHVVGPVELPASDHGMFA